MRLTADLRRLVEPTHRRLSIVFGRVHACGSPPTPEEEREIALAIIDAHGCWANFSKHFFISCCLGARTVSGARAACAALSFAKDEDVVRFSAAAIGRPIPVKRKRLMPFDEPDWHTPQTLLQLIKAAALSNEAQIQKALSIPGRSIDDLRVTRNFFAHRSHVAALRVQALVPRYGLPSTSRPAVFVGTRQPGKPYSIVGGWIAEMRSVVSLMGV